MLQFFGSQTIFKLVNWNGIIIAETLLITQKTRTNKRKLRIQFKSIVFNWRSRQHNFIARLQQTNSFISFRIWIFYCLRFIQKDVIEIEVFQEGNIAEHRSISCENNVIFLKAFMVLLAINSVN